MGKFQQFAFRLPSLPKEWYEKLTQLVTHLGLTQWQVTLLGYRAILHLGATDKAQLDAFVEEIKVKYPAKMKNEAR